MVYQLKHGSPEKRDTNSNMALQTNMTLAQTLLSRLTWHQLSHCSPEYGDTNSNMTLQTNIDTSKNIAV